MTTSPVPRRLDLITHDELLASVRSLLYTGIVYRLQGLEGTELTGAALPEVALKPWLETSLSLVLDYAQRGQPPAIDESLKGGTKITITPGVAVAQLENSLKGLLPELGRPWLLKNKDPQTSLECVLRGAHARLALKLGVSPGIPIGWVACLASIPVGTMRVYVGRDRLRDKAMKQGYLNPKVAMAWLEARGIEGPPITEKVPSPTVSFSIPNLKDKKAGYVAMKKAHEQLMSQDEVMWANPAKVYHTQEAIDHVAMQQLQAAAYKISAFGNVSGIALPSTEEVSQLVLSLPDEKLGTWAQEHPKYANQIWKCLDNVTDKTKYKEARDKLGAVLCWNEIRKWDSQGKVAEGFNSTVVGGTSLEEVMKSPKFELPPGTDPKIANALDLLEDCEPETYELDPKDVATAMLQVPNDILTAWYSAQHPNLREALAEKLDKAKGPKGTKARVKLGKVMLKTEEDTQAPKIKNALNILGSDDILYESTMIADAVLALPGPVLKRWVVEHIDKTKGFITLLNKANGTKAATAMKHLVISVGAAKQTQDKIDKLMEVGMDSQLHNSSMLGEATMLIPAGTPTMPIHGEKQIEYKVLKSKEPKAKVDELMKLVDSGAISFEKAKELAALSKEPVITGIQEPSLTFQHNAALASQCPVADWKSKPLSSYSDEHQHEYDPGEPLPHLVKKHDPELKAGWKKAAEVALLLQKLDEPGKSHG